VTHAPIASAASRPLFPATSLPQVGSALAGWGREVAVQILRTVLVDGEAKKNARTVNAGVLIQPLSARKIEMKPEGERNWKWNSIHASASLNAKNGDTIEIDGIGYRILGTWDYSPMGYYAFEAVEDYRHE